MSLNLSFTVMILALAGGLSIHPGADGQEEKSNDNEFVSEDFGFKISRLDDSWDFKSSNPKTGSLMLKISLKSAGGKTEVTILAEPESSSDEIATKRRDTAFRKTEGKNEFSNRSKLSFEVGGRTAPGFEMVWKIHGDVFRVQQGYIANSDFIYTVSLHSPVDQFDSFKDKLVDIRNSFELLTISEDARRRARLRRLVALCGSELNWARTWDEAATRAKREQKSILVLVRSQPGFDISDGMTTIALMDQDVIEFLNENCIVFRYGGGAAAPIKSYDKYGIGPGSFGNTVLLVEPDGTVFGDTFSYEPVTFYDFLLHSFADRQQKRERPDDLNNKIEISRWYTRNGNFDSALTQLDGLATVEAHRQRSTIYRRQRRGEAAVRELELARDKSDDEKLRAEMLFDETVIRLYASQTDAKAALDVFDDVLTTLDMNHPRAAEIMYWRGLCQFAGVTQYGGGNKILAENTWLAMDQIFEDDNRWNWKAGATLNSTAFKMGIAPEFAWPKEDAIRAFRSIPFEKLDVEQIDEAQRQAIIYLLRNQRDDGSWISPPDALRSKAYYTTSPFSVAITSICAQALLPHRGEFEVAERIERAFDFLVQSNRESKTKIDQPFYMDYSPWADAYLLRFLSAYARAYPERRTLDLRRLANDAVDALQKKQKPGGGWSYYITHNLSQADRPSNQSISFMTAAVTIALLETRDAGFEVPETLSNKAIECLHRMRNRNKTFTYFLWHEREGSDRQSSEQGAAGRGPLCSLALLRAGRGSEEEICGCLDLFLKHRDTYTRERGKSLMHAAPDGQGSHYLMFDYAWAAAAAAELNELTPEQKDSYRTRLLEMILQSRSQQGSYLDNPINGWHYGTGMALEAITLLR